MASEQFSNGPQTTLNVSGGINSTVTSLVVTSVSGFPSVPQFRIQIESELLLVTNVSGTTYTVMRGVEGTMAASHANGVAVSGVLTAGALGGSSDAATSTPSLRSLGNSAQQACAGNDSRLSVFAASGASHAAGIVPDPGSVAGTTHYLREDSTWQVPPTGGGSVTSVGLSMPAEFSVTGSPVTTSGTLTVSKANQNANLVYAGPSSGAAAAPTFRAQAFADLPTLNGGTLADVGLADQIPEYNNAASANRDITVERLLGFALPPLFDFRLTLTSGVAVTTSDVTAAGTIYLTPKQNMGGTVAGTARLSLYDGTRWKLYTNAEISLALTLTSGNVYDIFVFDNSGTITLEAVVWTNTTTRGTAIDLQDGQLVKHGVTSRVRAHSR